MDTVIALVIIGLLGVYGPKYKQMNAYCSKAVEAEKFETRKACREFLKSQQK
tara:strand:- start:603 stop:758 length:156 start_codon:yes stop_codon:yes gene_type:complete